ncbi:unnamed protein product, partial [Amoebophrya sp. A25]
GGATKLTRSGKDHVAFGAGKVVSGGSQEQHQASLGASKGGGRGIVANRLGKASMRSPRSSKRADRRSPSTKRKSFRGRKLLQQSPVLNRYWASVDESGTATAALLEAAKAVGGGSPHLRHATTACPKQGVERMSL